MDEETQKKVEATVLEILRGSDLESVVRNAAARLGIDLSLKDRRLFVHRVVEDYLHSLSQEDEQQQQQGGAGGDDKGKQEKEEEEEEKEGGGGKRKYGDLILCHVSSSFLPCLKTLGFVCLIGPGARFCGVMCSRLQLLTKRRVTLQEFRGKTLVSIREYYYKDGKELPTPKGIILTVEQWEAFRDSVPAIDDAIKKLDESDRKHVLEAFFACIKSKVC